MSPDVITAIVALLGGVAGKSIIDWIRDWTKGRMDQAQKIQRRLDRETARRRDAESALHASRLMLINMGAPPDSIPKMPADNDR
ncbi:hypothetical protein ACHABQ_02855 [Nesterenkonia aurantiaca]|uniref:hypothetical protein n=1 Tax=Nesterenkonia aurantiaca TaxID=1436010 RepID=UPI003EE61B69